MQLRSSGGNYNSFVPLKNIAKTAMIDQENYTDVEINQSKVICVACGGSNENVAEYVPLCNASKTANLKVLVCTCMAGYLQNRT